MITDEMLARAAYEVDMAILKQLPDPSECKHVFSDSFEKKMAKLLRRAKHYVAYKVLQRVACILISLLISASMILTFNTEARAAFLDWVEEHLDGFYHYFFVGEEAPVEPQSYRPGWLPEGYTLLDSFEAKNGETILYVSAEGKMLQFMYMYGTDNQELLMGEGEYQCKYVAIDGYTAEVFLSANEDNTNAITWSWDKDGVMFTVAAFEGEPNLIKIAESVVTYKAN